MTKTYSGKIEGLYIYPVKSLAGISLISSSLSRYGLTDDRQWMLIDEKSGFLSQRKLPKMATITTAIRHGKVFLSKPGLGEVEVSPLQEKIPVTIWRDHCDALVANEEVNHWLCDALETHGIKCVQFIPNEIRTPAETSRFGETAKHFADAAPFLISTVESLNALNQALLNEGTPEVNNRHFRPNIVISGLDAFAEHDLSKMHVINANKNDNGAPNLGFRLVDHCQRCAIITVDPDTGEFRAKGTPLVALAKLNGMPNKPKAPAFGVNATLQIAATSGASLSTTDDPFSPLDTEIAVGQELLFS